MSDGPEAPDVAEAARVEGYESRLAAQAETLANRPSQYGPKWNTEWTRQAIDPKTGLPYDEGLRDFGWDHEKGEPLGGYIAPGNRHYEWTQNNTLTDPFQKLLDQQMASAEGAQSYRDDQLRRWADNEANFMTDGVDGTISTDALGQFGQNQGNMGADDWRQFAAAPGTLGQDDWRQFGSTDSTIGGGDWRQFGSTAPTIGADQWQDLGYTDSTIGSDDWRQFGNTEQTVQSGDWDARWGSSQDHGYGDHNQGGGDWDYIDYTPEHIRAQAEQQTLDFMNSQLDPQWETKREALEVQLANQGLQWGDAAYDNAMSSFERSQSNAYSGARNTALADSRAEAMMLWDQEMGRSEQKNKYYQMDQDNEYRARQANISNYLSGRGQDQSSYLAFQDTAFQQDLAARQQQLNADLGYGREAYGQDLQSRQQALDAQLGYGSEAFKQDYQSREADRQANLDYGREAYNQDYQTRQQTLESDLAYGRENWNQDFQTRQQELDANRLYSQQAFDQDLQARQANISNYLNFGSAEFDQGMQNEQLTLQQQLNQAKVQQDRYALANPADNAANIAGILSP